MPAQSVAVSASADRQSLSTLSRVSPSISIIGYEPHWLELELERDTWLVSVVAASVVGPCRRARTHILSTGGSFLLLECDSAGVCFCWRELLLAWLAYAAAGVAGGASAGGLH